MKELVQWADRYFDGHLVIIKCGEMWCGKIGTSKWKYDVPEGIEHWPKFKTFRELKKHLMEDMPIPYYSI